MYIYLRQQCIFTYADNDYRMEQAYVGCWTDSSSITNPDLRDFHTYLIKDSYSLTVPQCIQACRAQGFRYAGLQVKIINQEFPST